MLFGRFICHVAITSTLTLAAPVSIMTSALAESLTHASISLEGRATTTTAPLILVHEKMPVQDAFVYTDNHGKPVHGVVFVDDDGNLRVAIDILDGQMINSTLLLDQVRSRNLSAHINEPILLKIADQPTPVPAPLDYGMQKPPEAPRPTIIDDAKMAANGTVYALAVMPPIQGAANANTTGCSPDCEHIRELEVSETKKNKKKHKKHKDAHDKKDKKEKKDKKHKKTDKMENLIDGKKNEPGPIHEQENHDGHHEHDGHENHDHHHGHDGHDDHNHQHVSDSHDNHEGHHGHDEHGNHDDKHRHDDHESHGGHHGHDGHENYNGDVMLDKTKEQGNRPDNDNHVGHNNHVAKEEKAKLPDEAPRAQDKNAPKFDHSHNQTYAVPAHAGGEVRPTPPEKLVEPMPIRTAELMPGVGGSVILGAPPTSPNLGPAHPPNTTT